MLCIAEFGVRPAQQQGSLGAAVGSCWFRRCSMPLWCGAGKGEVTYRRRNKPPRVATPFPVTAESHADVPRGLGKPLIFLKPIFY